jgi:hypothetical protein
MTAERQSTDETTLVEVLECSITYMHRYAIMCCSLKSIREACKSQHWSSACWWSYSVKRLKPGTKPTRQRAPRNGVAGCRTFKRSKAFNCAIIVEFSRGKGRKEPDVVTLGIYEHDTVEFPVSL